MNFPEKLIRKIEFRKTEKSIRSLGQINNLVDFSSNDYLGFAKSNELHFQTNELLIRIKGDHNGATGSRLLSGNHVLYNIVEEELTSIHSSEAALIFNSGYNANLGLFSSVPQRGDIILYDEFIHASIRDGMQLSNAKSYKFDHNNIADLEEKLKTFSKKENTVDREIYVVTESVFSMDGDSPELEVMCKICEKYGAYLIVDEAHALGVFGKKGLGATQESELNEKIFARILTFGKGLGCHGAVVLGSKELKQFLVNYSRSFIYTTGLAPHTLATIKTAYELLQSQQGRDSKALLEKNILHFKKTAAELKLNFIESSSAIHCCIISGNQKTKEIAKKLLASGFDVKPILSPTVAKGKERLRFCLHSYNTFNQITEVLEKLATFAV
ncbi:8-amino-7-oxononanoate synthase [Tenacibaculum sp. MAR_2009_124]|uniref:aminotransferase class I/II-fold pyridoxal phosphate-dependent enzyme n=1 Tax=Tenacibaculum sp. MAR_2009_124 TaxID=1250059 RepID=UPI00089A49DF|nr:pyridoxal phosphate-dependent aminotransferase family protein [Tenacibaculum sp. MAR_2009_124]SEC27464.1 8-amino-7-oxononanoate synthase [Tenacibaculum sp. MAR_2009_124]